MNKIFSLFVFLALSVSGFARLGDTEEQAQARYGLQKMTYPPGTFIPLIEGARELIFEYGGWRIRCALLRAKDDIQYVVREEYTKLPGKLGPKTGSSITDYERVAVLAGEAGAHAWRPVTLGAPAPTPTPAPGPDPVQRLANELSRISGLKGSAWVREDGVIGRFRPGSDVALLFDLPQALRYEAELKAIKDRANRTAVPVF